MQDNFLKMETLKFKTNINCGGCVKSVTPFLDKADGIRNWEVDTNSPDKILTVQVDNMPASDVKEILKKAGYNAEEVR